MYIKIRASEKYHLFKKGMKKGMWCPSLQMTEIVAYFLIVI